MGRSVSLLSQMGGLEEEELAARQRVFEEQKHKIAEDVKKMMEKAKSDAEEMKQHVEDHAAERVEQAKNDAKAKFTAEMAKMQSELESLSNKQQHEERVYLSKLADVERKLVDEHAKVSEEAGAKQRLAEEIEELKTSLAKPSADKQIAETEHAKAMAADQAKKEKELEVQKLTKLLASKLAAEKEMAEKEHSEASSAAVQHEESKKRVAGQTQMAVKEH